MNKFWIVVCGIAIGCGGYSLGQLNNDEDAYKSGAKAQFIADTWIINTYDNSREKMLNRLITCEETAMVSAVSKQDTQVILDACELNPELKEKSYHE